MITGWSPFENVNSMSVSSDEKTLITRAQRGDKMAISTLYSAHVQAIYKYVRYRVDTDAQAEDITSEVFLRMVRELPRYQYTGAPLSAWLYRTAYNIIVDTYRSQRFQAPEDLPEDLASDYTDPVDTFALAQDHEQLRAALKTLSPDYQNVLVLRFINDVSHAEVAEIMGKTEASARVLQHRALKALGAALQQLQQRGVR